MEEVMAEIMPACGLSDPETWPNSCNLNCYADGSDAIDWHADDEALFQGTSRNSCIVSLSLGETRTFELKLKDQEQPEICGSPSGEAPPKCQLRLQSGDICTMEGMVQKHYLHRIPKQSGRSL